jgi:hypothetical protein
MGVYGHPLPHAHEGQEVRGDPESYYHVRYRIITLTFVFCFSTFRLSSSSHFTMAVFQRGPRGSFSVFQCLSVMSGSGSGKGSGSGSRSAIRSASAESGSFLVEAEAEMPENMPLLLLLCFIVAVQFLVDVC